MEIHFVKNRNLTEFLILFQAKWNDGATPWHLSSSYCTKMQLNSPLGHLWAWLESVTPPIRTENEPGILMFFILVTHICSIAHLHSHKDTSPKTISEHSNLGKGRCCLVAKLSDFCDPIDCSLPGSSVHGIFQARILEGVAISFSREIFLAQGPMKGKMP